VNAGQGGLAPFHGLPSTTPDGRVNNVSELSNIGRSYYNGVTASVTHRLTKGFTGQVSYTYSHATDDVSNGGVSPFNASETGGSQLVQLAPQSLRSNYSNADYDVRHNLVASYIWDLPFKTSSGILNQIVGGWSISGTVFARSGYPFSALNGLVPLLLQNAVNASETIAKAVPAQANIAFGITFSVSESGTNRHAEKSDRQ